jgi:hypothetical protein
MCGITGSKQKLEARTEDNRKQRFLENQMQRWYQSLPDFETFKEDTGGPK